MYENLLGYLLGALDADEHTAIHQQLDNDPELRRKLSDLESRLAPLEAQRWQQFEPPARLATATCQLVANHTHSARARTRLPSGSSAFDPPRAGVSWSLTDMVVAAGVFIAISCLFLPAIANSRYQAQMAACKNNLRDLFGGLSKYSDANNGVFPSPLTQANVAMAGMFAPRLVEPGYVADQNVLLCPTDRNKQSRNFRVPPLSDLQRAPVRSNLWSALRHVYGYNVGYIDENNRYRAPRDKGRRHMALIADRPLMTPNGLINNSHHGRGMNVLVEDGHVVQLPAGVCNIGNDNIFRNDDGLIRPGTHEDDAVIGPAVRKVLIVRLHIRAAPGAQIRITPIRRPRTPVAKPPVSTVDRQAEL